MTLTIAVNALLKAVTEKRERSRRSSSSLFWPKLQLSSTALAAASKKFPRLSSFIQPRQITTTHLSPTPQRISQSQSKPPQCHSTHQPTPSPSSASTAADGTNSGASQPKCGPKPPQTEVRTSRWEIQRLFAQSADRARGSLLEEVLDREIERMWRSA